MPRRFDLLSRAELRVASGKQPKIIGKIPYMSESEDMGGTVEVLRPGCFRNAIKNGGNIISLWQHDTAKPLGNTTKGTLILRDTPEALHVEIKPDTSISWCQDAIKAVRGGSLNGMSFGFMMKRGGDEYEGNTRYINDVGKLLEVSPVTWPAYPQSTIAVRKHKKTNFRSGKRHDKKMEYSREYCNELLEKMERSSGSELYDLGDEFDQVAPIVYGGDCPTFSEVGQRGISAWMQKSKGVEKTHIGDRESRSKPKQIFSSLGEQIRAIVEAGTPGGKTDPRLHEVRAVSGLSEGIPSDGGFLLESTFTDKLLENVWNNNDVLKLITKLTVGGNSNGMIFPGFDETSRATGSRYGGVQSYWRGEAGTYTGSKPKFRRIELKLNKLIGLIYMTEELMEDSVALNTYCEKAMKGEIDFRIQDAIIRGSGVGQPLGILNSSAMISVAKETGQAADTVVWENISKMWARLLATSRKDAVWIINQDVEPSLYSMSLAVGTGGVPVYMPAGGASSSPYSTLFGRPVIPIEQAPTVGDTGDIMLCDFKNGYIGIDKSPRFDSSIHVLFTVGEETLRFQYRFDGQPVLASALTPFSAGDTQSHFVKLDAR